MTKSNHKINFGPGPAMLPKEVLQQASEAVVNYNDTGLSILEIPHRGQYFDEILQESQALVRDLCGLNDDYEVLWLHGGGRLQFCMVPMNFLDGAAGYIDSGHWANEAMSYASYYGKVEVLASSKEDNYRHLPEWPMEIPAHLSYLHFTTNNTIFGTQWPQIPKTNIPLIADMSSDIFSRRMDYSNCAMFYAVAQKNIGPAGVTLAVVRKDMLSRIKRTIPPMLDYAAHVAKGSVLNTPPVFAIYTSLLTMRWTKNRGIDVIGQENSAKATLLYEEINRNSLFHTVIRPEDRSMMNACFAATHKEHERAFIKFCEERNITGVEGHRSVGAFRASLYNAISLHDVQALVQAMQEFERHFGDK
ncbi:MAG: 3-phosphoserine/phosphohydroxythreonine transaminase [Sphingobacteriales bacterium]|nr:MAG: 3-phosphoserine/phosphohydroxythreonine transaminase [Sphingobacteriales bacterium]